MSTKSLVIIGSIFAIIIIAIGLFVAKMNISTALNNLKVEYEGEVRNLGNYHDNLIKTLFAVLGINSETDINYNTYLNTWENSVSKGVSLDQAVQSTFPLFFAQAGVQQQDLQIKSKLMDLVNIKRNEFRDKNTYAISICVEYNKFVGNAWNKLFLNAEQEKTIECKTITSDVSEKALETGRDNNFDLNEVPK